MKFTDSFRKALLDEVVGVQGGYGASFKEDSPPEAEIRTKEEGKWIWIHTEADYEGATWDYTTDRASGDPYSAHVYNDWIGRVETAPDSVSEIDELNKWAIVHTKTKREYTDVGVWGVQSGRWIDSLSEEGVVKYKIVSSNRFQDVSPTSLTTSTEVDLGLFEKISFDSLTQLIEHDNEFIREITANQLGELGDIRAVYPFLIKATQDESEYVKGTAIGALGKLGGERAIMHLITILLESSRYQRELPKRAIVNTGEMALTFLTPLIASDEEFLSITIVEIIEQIGGTQAGRILSDALVEKRTPVRSRIIEALPKFDGLDVVDTLLEDLKQGEYEVRVQAALALGRIRDNRAIEGLKAALKDSDRNVRSVVALALEEFGWQPSTDDDTALLLFAGGKWKELAAMGSKAIEVILLALKDMEARSNIISELNEAHVSLDDRRVIKPIVKYFNDAETIDYRRRASIWVLARTCLSQAIMPIIKIYMTERREYLTKPAFEAIEYLASNGTPVAKKLVQTLTKKEPKEYDTSEIKSYLKLFTIVPATKKQIERITLFLKSVAKRRVKDVTKIARDLLRIVKLSNKVTVSSRSSRGKAVEALGKTLLPSAAVHLILALGDEFPVIRMDAVKFLGQIKNGILSLLLDALNSEILNVRFGAIEAIGQIQNSSAAKSLLESIDDPSPIIRQNATWAIGNLYVYQDRHTNLRGDIISALENAMFADDYIPVRINATYSMAEMLVYEDNRAIDSLLKALFDPEVKVRLNASYGFVKGTRNLHDNSTLLNRVVKKLIIALSDDHPSVRYNVVDALRFSKGEKAIAALKAVDCKDDEKMRELVEKAISELEAFKDRTRSSWQFSARYHVELNLPDDVDRLIEALGDKKESVQRSAQIALGKMHKFAFDRCMEILQDKTKPWLIREGVAGALGRMYDERAVDALIEALSDDVKEVRGNAAWSLAELKDKRSIKAMVKATKDEYWLVRLNAAAGLGKMGGRAAFEALLRLLDDEHWHVRQIATSYLGQFKSPRVIPALKKMCEDEDERVREMAKSWYDHLMKKKKT